MIAGVGLDVEIHGCISITGTPGVGKTTIAQLLSSSIGFDVVSIEKVASDSQCFAGVDESDKTSLIDVDCLQAQSDYRGKNLIIEGHLSHFVPSDIIIILRCHPQEIQRRLEQRDYSPDKIRNNVEWELIGGVWTELEEVEHGASLLEFNTSTQSPEAITTLILECLTSGMFMKNKDDVIDWFEEA
jgi:adenylate kinase